MNIAVTVETRFSEKRHIGFVPGQGPAQRENFHPIVGFAASEIVPTLKQFTSVDWVKIYGPGGQTENPNGPSDSIPFCLEP